MTIIFTDKQQRRAKRVRAKLKNNLSLPRLTVFRSHQHLWAQIIDDKKAKTLLSATTKNIKSKGNKTDKATDLGKIIANLALKLKITRIRFDRGPYKYHGRVKALAEAVRHGGLKF